MKKGLHLGDRKYFPISLEIHSFHIRDRLKSTSVLLCLTFGLNSKDHQSTGKSPSNAIPGKTELKFIPRFLNVIPVDLG